MCLANVYPVGLVTSPGNPLRNISLPAHNLLPILLTLHLKINEVLLHLRNSHFAKVAAIIVLGWFFFLHVLFVFVFARMLTNEHLIKVDLLLFYYPIIIMILVLLKVYTCIIDVCSTTS